MRDSPNLLSASQASARIASGLLSVEALIRACLERITERDESIRAWDYIDPEGALREARLRDRERTRSPLHGIPIGVKNVIDTYDMPTTYGSPIYEGYRPRRDAACVALCRRAGAIIIGKTVSAEFAFFTPGETANPHNTNHTPGGSSSGSAAAVADHMVPLAFGTQTAGSVIRPAAFCGVVGYKPSFGLISRAGVLPFSESHDTVGVLARTVTDAAVLASVASGSELRMGNGHPPEPIRLGVWRTHDWEKATDESREALLKAADRLNLAGAILTDVVLPDWFGDLSMAQSKVMAYEAARTFAHERRVHEELLSSRFRGLLEEGDGVSWREYKEAQDLAHAARVELTGALERQGSLLTVSTIGEAPAGLLDTGDPLFNRAWSLLHVPCVHIPAFTGPRGLPVGIQLIGRVGGDAEILAAASWVQLQLSS